MSLLLTHNKKCYNLSRNKYKSLDLLTSYDGESQDQLPNKSKSDDIYIIREVVIYSYRELYSSYLALI